MWIRLRQIALVSADLRRAALEIGEVLGLEACHVDPGVAAFGLKNTLWPIGSQFLEVVTPTVDGTAGGRYLERRGGDGGYMLICQVDDVARRRQRAAELGIRAAFELSFPDEGHDGVQLHPADTGGTLWEMDQVLVDGGDAIGGPWYPAGPAWQPFVRTERVGAITGAEIQSPEPVPLAERWAAMAELDLTTDGDGHPTLELDNATVRFVEALDGRGEGLGAIDVTATDRDAVRAAADRLGCTTADDQVELVGLRFNLREELSE